MYLRRAIPFAALAVASVAVVAAGMAALSSSRGGAVRVRSDPTGAAVFVDGMFRGRTPIEVNSLAPGAHALRIQKAGFEAFFARVEVSGGGSVREVSARLEPVRVGELSVATEPPGAELFVDGEFRGRTPAVIGSVRAGPHVLRVEKTNFTPRTLTVLVRAGEKTSRRLEMEDRVLAFLEAAALEEPDEVFRHMELGHYCILRGDADGSARAYARALALARRPGTDARRRGKVEKSFRTDRQRGELGARMGAEVERIMRGSGPKRRSKPRP